MALYNAMLQATISIPLTLSASDSLYLAVRSALVARNTSLSEWCRANSVSRQTMEKALKGEREGRRSRSLRNHLIKELFGTVTAT
jgi:DNA-binding phage protein